MNWDAVVQIVTAFFGTLGFCVLFQLRGGKLWLGALGGLLSWSVFLALGTVLESEVLRYFIVSVLITVYSEVFARIMKTPTTTFCIVSLIPLVPGGSLYYSVTYALEQNWSAFMAKATYTFELAAALSAGILLVTAGTRTVKRFLSEKKRFPEHLR